jgi:hypothetical protein
VADTLSPAGIDALLSATIPYVHVPRFLAPAWCEEVVRRFTATIADLPEHRSLVMGPALLDTLAKPVELFVDSADPDDYFNHVARDAPRVRMLFAGGDDPLEMMRHAWRSAGWTEIPAAEDERRRYHPDAVWALRRAAAPPHVDSYEHDRTIALSRFERRFNYNVYIQNADAGGDFVLYNRYASAGPDGARLTSLDPAQAAALLGGATRLEHRPAPGDLVIFDAMLYHEVTLVDGIHRPRIQLHSNMLLDPAAREFLFFV